jgi:2-oxoglutarate ferredoxin oxidoreductase subunit alpha
VATYAPAPDIQIQKGASIGVVTIGGCDGGVREAIAELGEDGIIADYMRIKAFPFSAAVEEFLRAHTMNFIVEQNRDAQLKTLLIAETGIHKECLQSVLVYGGFPLSAYSVVDAIKKQLGVTHAVAKEGVA